MLALADMDSQLGLPSILFSAAASPTQTLVHTTQSEFCLFQIRCPFREREKKGGGSVLVMSKLGRKFFFGILQTSKTD